ncbi:MAG TPA: PAS domain S-box protein [Methanoregula sp.]|nr:PAS domain S-box protein [Methanoregula sp.]
MSFLEDQAGIISRIREILREHPKGLTIEEIAKTLPLNRTSTAKYLNTLLISGQAELNIYGRAKVFTLSQRVPFSQMLNLSSDLMLVLDHDFLVRQVNEPFLHLFGISREAILGLKIDSSPLKPFFPGADLDLAGTAQTGTEHTKMERIEIAGQPYFFRIKMIPVVFDQGEKGIAVILEDLTELKKHQDHLEQLVEARTIELKTANENLAEEIQERLKSGRALAESERKYRELVENANSIILRADERGRITFFSEFAESFFGISEAEVLGKDLIGTIILPPAHSRKSTAEQNQEFLRPAKHMMFKETEVIRKNGEIAWVAWTIKEVQEEGMGLREFLIVGMDITVLKTYTERSQRLVEKLEAGGIGLPDQPGGTQRPGQSSGQPGESCTSCFDSAPAGFFTIDPQGTISALNRTGADLLGVSVQNGPGRTFSDFIEERDRASFSAFLHDVFHLPGTQDSVVHFRGIKNAPVFCRGRVLEEPGKTPYLCGIVAVDMPNLSPDNAAGQSIR